MKAPVRLLVVEDHALVLEALQAALGRDPEIEVAGIAHSKAEAIEFMHSATLDLIITDLKLRDGLGTDLIKVASACSPPIPVLLMSGAGDGVGLRAALQAGGAGFVSKNEPLSTVVSAALAAGRGLTVFSAEAVAAARTSSDTPVADLTNREFEVLRLLARGESVGDITESLQLSVHTVRSHVRRLIEKLGANSQLEAVVIAARRGLVQLE